MLCRIQCVNLNFKIYTCRNSQFFQYNVFAIASILFVIYVHDVFLFRVMWFMNILMNTCISTIIIYDLNYKILNSIATIYKHIVLVQYVCHIYLIYKSGQFLLYILTRICIINYLYILLKRNDFGFIFLRSLFNSWLLYQDFILKTFVIVFHKPNIAQAFLIFCNNYIF